MFIKPASSLVGHGGAIECKPHYGRVHPEPELAVVIGKTAKNIAARDAYDYVFGYTIHNDITSPTMRAEDTFHYRAIHPKAGDPKAIEYVDTWVSYPGRYKCCDTFACMGPWLVTKDEIADPHNLAVSCSHKDQLVTEDNTENLFYKIPEVLEFLSSHLTLLPGDIVSMGTALKKSAQGGAVQNIDLNKLGGPVSVTIEKIGTLTQRSGLDIKRSTPYTRSGVTHVKITDHFCLAPCWRCRLSAKLFPRPRLPIQPGLAASNPIGQSRRTARRCSVGSSRRKAVPLRCATRSGTAQHGRRRRPSRRIDISSIIPPKCRRCLRCRADIGSRTGWNRRVAIAMRSTSIVSSSTDGAHWTMPLEAHHDHSPVQHGLASMIANPDGGGSIFWLEALKGEDNQCP